MLCPTNHFTVYPFAPFSCDEVTKYPLIGMTDRDNISHSGNLDLFAKQTYPLPFSFMGISSVTVSQAQLSACLFGLFASLISPFGGFLASGMKRAYSIKDFSDTLPGHGGFVDRFDCIMCIVVFAYVFLN